MTLPAGITPPPPPLSASEAEALAVEHGLELTGQRPGLLAYLRDVWRHRHLMWAMSKGKFVAEHQDNYLGLVWAVINPILLGVAYYFIFGVFIGTRGNIDNFVSFLTIGLFTYIPISVAMTSGAKSVLGKTRMMQSLQFPRALLPITVVLAQLVSNMPAFVVLVGIALISGEKPDLEWLLYVPALLIVMVMSMGIALLLARLVHDYRDLNNLVPLLVRLLRYVSGIFYSIHDRLAAIDAPLWISLILQYQPVAVSLDMVRETLMNGYSVNPVTWLVASGWAVFFLVVGFVVFWRGEGTYGRG